MAYRIEFRPAAARALRKLDPTVQPRIHGAIALLAQEPRPPAARALRGRPGLRVRVGDYRILYTVDDDILLVVVVALGHRRDVYEHRAVLPRRAAELGPAYADAWQKWEHSDDSALWTVVDTEDLES